MQPITSSSAGQSSVFSSSSWSSLIASQASEICSRALREAQLGRGTTSRATSSERRRLQWSRWAVVGRLLPDERMVDCRQYASFSRLLDGRAPSIVAGESGCSFSGLAQCGSIWGCPLCSGVETDTRRRALESAVDGWRYVDAEPGQLSGKGFLLISWTFPHKLRDSLAANLDLFARACVWLHRHREFRALLVEFGFQHSVRSLEVTVGPKYGWHPHRHDLWFTTWRLSDGDATLLEDLLVKLWVRACRAVGLIATDLQASRMSRRDADGKYPSVNVKVGYDGVSEYLEKHGEQPRWSLAAEVTKAASKAGRGNGFHFSPFQLLDAIADVATSPEDVARYEAWFVEYYRAFKGRRQLVWSDGAKEALAYSEADAADDCSKHELLECTWPEWLSIRRAGAHASVLDACEVGGYAGYFTLVNALVLDQCRAADTSAVSTAFSAGNVWCGLDGRYRFVDGGPESSPRRVPDWVSEQPDHDDPAVDDLALFGVLPEWVF